MEKPHSQTPGDGEPTNRLGQLVDYYPDNLLVRYAVAPLARHFWKCLLAILIFVYGSLITCNIWTQDQKLCDRRWNYLVFIVGAVLFGLTLYAGYLQRKVKRQLQEKPQ